MALMQINGFMFLKKPLLSVEGGNTPPTPLLPFAVDRQCGAKAVTRDDGHGNHLSIAPWVFSKESVKRIPAFSRAQSRSAFLIASLVTACAVAAAQEQSPSKGLLVYTCVDAMGRALSSDRPIKECMDREQRILGGVTGHQKGVLPPSYTNEERAALQAQAEALATQQKLAKQQSQKMRLLRLRYPDRASFERARQAATTQIDSVISSAQEQLKHLNTLQEVHAQELEFYQGDLQQAPAALRGRIEKNHREIANQQNFIAHQQQEKERIQGDYDADLPLLESLWIAEPPE